MKCRYPHCDREAMKNWTMCARHHSAGDSVKNDKRKREATKKKEKASA